MSREYFQEPRYPVFKRDRRPSVIGAILFSRSQHKRGRLQVGNVTSAPIELRVVRVTPGRKDEVTSTVAPAKDTFATRFEAEFDEVFGQEIKRMSRELQTPITRTSRGSDIMKTKFNKAIAANLKEHELIMRGIAGTSDPEGITAEELIQEAEELGLDPQEVMQEILFGEERATADSTDEY